MKISSLTTAFLSLTLRCKLKFAFHNFLYLSHRQAQTNRNNKVGDLNCPAEYGPTENGNVLKKSLPAYGRTAPSVGTDNNNRNRMVKVGIQSQVSVENNLKLKIDRRT